MAQFLSRARQSSATFTPANTSHTNGDVNGGAQTFASLGDPSSLVKIEGGTVVQLPVGHRPRRAGTSKYGVWNRVFRSFVDLLAVRWMKQRHLDYEVVRHDP